MTDRPRFENGLAEMYRRLQPHTILVYGSANYPCFEKLKEPERMITMIKTIRILLEYNTYCLWLYNEFDEIIDNDKYALLTVKTLQRKS